MSLMEKIFGDLNEKEVKKVSRIADKVMAYDEEMQKLTDQQLRDRDCRVQRKDRIRRDSGPAAAGGVRGLP